MEIEKMGFLKNFDLVFAHMTPAIADYYTLEKMCNCSRNKCFLVKPSRRNDCFLFVFAEDVLDLRCSCFYGI